MIPPPIKQCQQWAKFAAVGTVVITRLYVMVKVSADEWSLNAGNYSLGDMAWDHVGVLLANDPIWAEF